MSIERAIYEKLNAVAGATGKVFAQRAPQNQAAPFVIFQRVAAERWRSMNAPSGWVQATIQIDAYAATYYGAKDLALLIEKALDGFSGVVPYGTDSPRPTVKIGGISLQNDVDIFDKTDAPFLHRVSADYLVTYEQT